MEGWKNYYDTKIECLPMREDAKNGVSNLWKIQERYRWGTPTSILF